MSLHVGRRTAWMSALALSITTTLPALAADPPTLPAPSLKIGDSWVFDRALEHGTTGFSSERLVMQVEQLRDSLMVVGVKKDGAPGAFEDHMMGLDWSQRRMVDGEETVTGRPFDFPMAVGKTWKADFIDPTHRGAQVSARVRTSYKVTGWEDVTTPAGTFHAMRIEGSGTIKAQMGPSSATIGGATTSSGESTVIGHSQVSAGGDAYLTTYIVCDYVPSVKYYVKRVEEEYNAENVRVSRSTDTLASFKPAS